ncbi:aminotransferase class I/II-fold pyridoxal phosphate-dependent enzyme [Dactylosporangium sp. NPDC051541]|uniref:aminotransferase class I/II-fold pyridoxal phosphate-dependent enzyme n=1 Tax=Dactylosporangium sp. NPDC051541 TaxID=3363977 RepID=UPI0037B58C7C
MELLAGAYRAAFAEYGAAGVTYGHDPGPETLRGRIAELCEGGRVGVEHVAVTAGTSSGLALLARYAAAPGDVVFAEAASYDFALQLFREHGLRVCQVGGDSGGIDPARLADAVRGERAAGRRGRLLYLIPTFQNPTGTVLPVRRRRELLDVARDHELLVVEDDPYALLALDGEPPPPGLGDLGGYDGVVRLGSFSKILAPGLRLGWLCGSPEYVARLTSTAVFVSGGCLNHLAAVAVERLLEAGRLAVHLRGLRAGLRRRRDLLAGAVGELLDVAVPDGGFFMWGRVGSAELAEELLARAQAVGVSLAAGARFGDPAGLRFSFSFQSPERIVEAGERLADAWGPLIGPR